MGLTTKRKLNIETVAVSGDLFGALKALSDIDNDFNGNNGDEYLSAEAKEAGYENNQEYLLNKVREESRSGEYESVDDIVQAFCKAWLDGDSHYEEWEVVCHFTNHEIDFIVLAYTTE